MAPTEQSTAYFNEISFPYNPNSVEWTYTLNKASFNTLGGRVTQLLSVKIGTVTWQGDAGSRSSLLDLYNSFNAIQDEQVKNEDSHYLIVFTQNLNINKKAWARSIEIGWDYQSVTYPYRIQFEIDEGFSDILSGKTSKEIDALIANIGWSAGSEQYSGIAKGKVKVNTSAEKTLEYAMHPPTNVLPPISKTKS